MSSFTQDEIDTLYATDNVEMLNSALARLDKEIPSVQDMYENAVKDGEKTGNFKLSVAILRGTKAGLKDHGLSPRIGLVPLRELKREIKNYLKSLPEVQPEVKEVIYGEPPMPSPEEAEAEQDAIEESMDRMAENNNPVLQEMILADKHQTEFEEEPDVAIHVIVHEERTVQEMILQQQMADERAFHEKVLKDRIVDEFTENFRNMLKVLFGIN